MIIAVTSGLTILVLEQSGKDDLYNAANRIGDAMTDFVGQFARPGKIYNHIKCHCYVVRI